jgi:gamma-glutamylcysteine synthetase
MKIIIVQYTTSNEFASKNQENISAIAKEVKALGHPGIRYSAYLHADGKTVTHFDHFANEEAHQILTGLDSFKKFDAELWANPFEKEPKYEELSLIDSSAGIFA